MSNAFWIILSYGLGFIILSAVGWRTWHRFHKSFSLQNRLKGQNEKRCIEEGAVDRLDATVLQEERLDV